MPIAWRRSGLDFAEIAKIPHQLLQAREESQHRQDDDANNDHGFEERMGV